ncbi:MAG: hypothetical protein NC395_08500 [Prevotella sp.]|nr:hypothetical protein [Prevotella sp.]
MRPNENELMNGGFPHEENGGDISMKIDTSSLRPEAVGTGSPDVIGEFEIEVENLPTAEDIAAEGNPAADGNAEADIDFIYGEDDSYDYTGSLEDISAESIALDSIDVKLEDMRTDKSSMISSLKNQMQADDLAMSVENRPKLDEMSDEYFPSQKNSTDIMAKEQLDRDEKELIKTRLKTEMEKKPEGYDQKKSLAMYKKLMDEQKAKAAKRGFVMLLIAAATGLASAVLIYLTEPNADGAHPIMDYLPIGAVVFSLFMLLKSKFAKIMSTLYFTVCTVMLIYPGLVGYALSPDNQNLGKDFVIKLVIYVAAVAMCAVTFIRLFANKDIEEYYSYKPGKSGRR